jgi:phage baseplate assembly protein W
VNRAAVHVGHPLRMTGRGRTALVDDATYVRGLVEAVLFTRPGERVNRPDFGSGIDQLVFAPSDGELAQATKALVQGALQRHLGELLRVDDVAVEAVESTLSVTVVYTPLAGGGPVGEQRSLTVAGGAGGAP